MIEQQSRLSSSSYSYLLNYMLQAPMYDWANKTTEETKDLKLLGATVWCASSLLTLITRVTSIPEVFLLGSGTFLTAPFTADPIKNAKIGLHEVFVHMPKNILRLACFPIEFVAGAIISCTDPKFLIIDMSQSMKINLLHAKNGTLNSEEYLQDIGVASGEVKVKYMAWQNKMLKRSLIEKGGIDEKLK